MSKVPMSFCVDDVSVLARSLRCQLEKLERVPSHVEMLNLLAKAAGYRNFQHFKSQNEVSVLVDSRQQPVEINDKLIKRLVRFFDEEGRLIRWPKKYTQRMICLWVMWSRIPPKTPFSESEISAFLGQQHLFGDHALLRRELVDRGLVMRTADGSEYRRIESRPPVDAVELFKYIRVQ
ncbi:DUF2087 domain-containing protein [uncultured Pseudodesulfovibrio sp.]|uniref:DUF2087 domain-containing protein n=1 Tax=uncultured Pseudodesulfovibrio sp. TaxID=2035858 RepID=UPI0029C94EAD|nr:DUF2087 domain-containing protein [uncultured Pseudodesulfovibrio sp.]